METIFPDRIPWPQLAAVLANQASEAERQALAAWRSASPENEARFRQVERLWILTGQLPVGYAFDSQADWPEMAKRAGLQPVDAPVRPLWPRRVWLRLAAVLLLLGLGALLRWYTQRGTWAWKEIAAIERVEVLTLPDGSIVSLRPGSRLRFPRPFDAGQRQVFLEGEAWFEVSHDTLRSFRVQSPNLRVEVLGTSFAVRDRSGDAVAQVDVASGRVRVLAQDSLLLSAGQSGRWDPDTLTRVSQSAHFLAWKARTLSFEAAPLAEVLPAMSRYYEREIRLAAGQRPPSSGLTATFRGESLREALEVLSLTLDLRIDTANEIILIAPNE